MAVLKRYTFEESTKPFKNSKKKKLSACYLLDSTQEPLYLKLYNLENRPPPGTYASSRPSKSSSVYGGNFLGWFRLFLLRLGADCLFPHRYDFCVRTRKCPSLFLLPPCLRRKLGYHLGRRFLFGGAAFGFFLGCGGAPTSTTRLSGEPENSSIYPSMTLR